MLLFVALVAALLRRDALGMGLIGDDYLQRAMISGLYPGEGYAPFDLYAFIRPDPALHEQLVEGGAAPWWLVLAGDPGAERGVIAFAVLRPLSSALLALDHALLPEAVFAWHLHSLLWFIAAIVALGFALRQIFGPLMAGLATLLFALDPAPLVSLAWIADRCVLVSACFGALALWAHVCRRRAGSGPRATRLLAVELGCVCLALAGGEYGVVALGYLVGWELAGSQREGGEPGDARARARACSGPGTALPGRPPAGRLRDSWRALCRSVRGTRRVAERGGSAHPRADEGRAVGTGSRRKRGGVHARLVGRSRLARGDGRPRDVAELAGFVGG